MIRSTGDKRTQRFLAGERVKAFESFYRQAWRRLDVLNNASSFQDLQTPGNRLHQLGGAYKGYHAIAINRQWRIVFIWDEQLGDAYDVRITDYH